MYRLICQKPAHFLSAQMALVSTFFQMFIVLGMYNFEKGLKSVEILIEKCGGNFCVGDTLTMADCCLVPQVYNANRFKVDMNQFPNINRIMKKLESIEAFIAAHPDSQPDKQ
jgi:glutathione S-transferase